MGASSKKILIVVARFNEFITKALLSGAESTLKDRGIDDYEICWVPGCFEIPVIAANAARTKRFAAVIALGCVIRGETPHFDYVAGETAAGLMIVSVQTGTPIIMGVLTTNTVDQAMNRAGIKFGNKGRDAAQTAIEMIAVNSQFLGSKGGSI